MSQENNIQKNSSPKIVVIALAIICIILAASLVGVIALNQPNDSQAQLAEKDNTIRSLQSQISVLQNQLSNNPNASTYVTQIAYLNQQLLALNDTLTAMNADLVYLDSITQLQATGTLYDSNFVQDANSSTTVWDNQLDYAGYIVVQASASANTTYAEVNYSYSESNFDYNQTLGTSGKVLFPVLPGAVMVRIGNINQANANNVTATVTYIY